MIELRDVGVRLAGRRVLDDLSLSLAEGSLTVLVGPNGAGKSTLLDVVRGYRRPDRGTVTLASERVHDLAPRRRAGLVGWLAQHPRVRDVMTVEEWLGTARFRFAETPRAARPAVTAALAEVGLSWAIDRLAHTLSGGEAQRVALAALIAQEARVWLLDEPTHHLDPAAVQEVLGVLRRRASEGQTMLVVAHHLDEIAAGFDPSELARVRVVGLRDGRLRFTLALERPAEVARALSDLYGATVEAVAIEGRSRFVVVP